MESTIHLARWFHGWEFVERVVFRYFLCRCFHKWCHQSSQGALLSTRDSSSSASFVKFDPVLCTNQAEIGYLALMIWISYIYRNYCWCCFGPSCLYFHGRRVLLTGFLPATEPWTTGVKPPTSSLWCLRVCKQWLRPCITKSFIMSSVFNISPNSNNCVVSFDSRLCSHAVMFLQRTHLCCCLSFSIQDKNGTGAGSKEKKLWTDVTNSCFMISIWDDGPRYSQGQHDITAAFQPMGFENWTHLPVAAILVWGNRREAGTLLHQVGWGCGLFLRWWSPSTMWAGPFDFFKCHHQGCLSE